MNSAPAPYQLRFTERARREIEALDGSVRKQLRKILTTKLAIHPAERGKPLTGILTGFLSHRFAAHRIIYTFDDGMRLVLICAVGPRRAGHPGDVYEQFEALVRAGRTARKVLDALRGAPPSARPKKP